MKRAWWTTGFVTTLLISTFGLAVEMRFPRGAVAHRLAQAPTVDGTIGDAEWAGAAWETAFVTLGVPHPAAKQTAFAVGYTADALYVVVRCDEPDNDKRKLLAKSSVELWRRDSVEIFVKRPDAKGYQQFFVSPTGHGFGLAYNPKSEIGDRGWTSAAKDTPTGYVVEAKLPRSLLGCRLRAGQAWRLNVARNSRTPNSNRHTTWATLDLGFREPEHFGDLLFLSGKDPLQRKRHECSRRYTLFSSFIVTYQGLYKKQGSAFADTIEAELSTTAWPELKRLARQFKKLDEQELDAANALLKTMQMWPRQMEKLRKRQLKKKLFQ